MGKYRILSLDGGGIRGLLTCVLLQRLEAEVPGWLNRVDLIAGTSTGGIMALALAYGLSPRVLRSLYYKKGPQIFKDSWWDDVGDFGRLMGADYDLDPLEELVRQFVGESRLRDLNKKVLICAFDLDNEHDDPNCRRWKPKFFHNFEGSDSDGEMLAYKVALYTAAAPTYFPSVDGFIDGGVAVNSPSMAAVVQTQDYRAHIANRPGLQEISLLSLGTGQTTNYIKGENLDWGYVQWARPLVQIMLDGTMGIADYQCRQLLGDRYHRVTPVLGQPFPLDDWRRRDELISVAERVELGPTVGWLKRHW